LVSESVADARVSLFVAARTQRVVIGVAKTRTASELAALHDDVE
jgi:hypothetical protein